ncbi:BglG family transcription antiterminator [Paenibacillus hodogayensis]|uniref:BglG family transcription antiterminator n=1 Tax=Paenibacillus hodogayensis TaxID=279208 RepID=A0ABV5W189_9BACL
MRLHARAREVLLALTESDQPLKIKQLAERFTVSERTIKYDLEQIRERLAGMDAQLLSRTNRGVWLEADAEARGRLREEMASEESASFENVQERQNRLALELLERPGFTTLDQLADRVQASRNTVLSDLQKAADSWRSWGIRLERESGKGVRLSGAEPDKRRLLQALAESALGGSDMLRIVRGLWWESVWPGDIARKLAPYLLDGGDMERLQAAAGAMLRIWKEQLGQAASDEAAIGLLFRFAVAVRRLRRGEALPNGADVSLIRQPLEAEEALHACRKLLAETMEALGVRSAAGQGDEYDSEAESVFVLMPLLSGEPGRDSCGREPEERRRRRAELASRVRALIGRLEEYTGLPLGRDAELYEGLLSHLARKADRRRFGVHDVNPLTAEIARTYPGLFEAVKQACLSPPWAQTMRTDDSAAAYIVLYVQAAIERDREQRRFRAVVVCGTGKGTARFLRTLIQNRVGHIEVAECCSVSEAEQAVARTEADLAISVLPMALPVPVVRVNPIPTAEDFEAIAACLARIERRSDRPGGGGPERQERSSAAQRGTDGDHGPAPLEGLLDRLDPEVWPEAERVGRELAIRGFELTQAIVGRFRDHLTDAAAAGLSLHIMLMVQRIAFGHPYERPSPEPGTGTPEESQWVETLAGIFGQHGLPAAEGEWRAIVRYFQPSGERGLT